MFTCTVNGDFTHISESVQTVTGYTPDELIGKHFTTLIKPSWHQRVTTFYENQRDIGQPETTYEFPIIHKNGSMRWVEQTVVFMGDQNAPFQAIVHDITERKREQIRDGALFEQSNDAVFLLDLDGKHIAVNQQAATMFGYSRDELLTMGIDDLVTEDEKDAAHHNLQKLFNNETLSLIERTFQRKDGSTFPAEVNAQIVRNIDGDPLHIQSLIRDVSERKNHEIEISRREVLYRTLARNLPDTGVVLFDQNMRYLVAEGDALTSSGYPPENIEGKTLYEVLSQSTVDFLTPYYQKALDGDYSQFTLKANDHDYVVRTLPVQENGTRIGMIVVQDVTAFKKSETALRESQERIRAMLKAVPDLMFVMRRDGTYVDFDWGTVLEGASNWFVGSNIKELGFDDDVLKMTFDHMTLAIDTGEMQKYLYEPKTEESTSAFEARVVALNNDEALFIIRDISDLKQVQADLAERVDQLTILHQFDEELADKLDIDYVLNMALDAALRLSHADAGYIGLTNEDGTMRLAKVTGDHIHEIADTNLQTGVGAVSRIVRQRKAELIPDVTVDPDYITNRPQTKAQITIPLVSQSNDLIGVLNLESNRYGVFTEDIFNFLQLITRRISVAVENARLYRKTEAQLIELRRLYDKVIGLEQLKTDMIRIASHDLRNPLATVLGYTQMIDAELDDDDDLREPITLIEQSARRMQKIIIDILSLERIEEMAQGSFQDVFNLNETVQRVFDGIKLQTKTHTMNVDLPDNALSVLGDPVQIREALVNLISNAVKYTPPQGKIDVKLTHEDNMAKLEVIDNGYGIREEQQERLFQPFYRARSSETASIEGTGLGLHLVKNIIERHNGTMIFHSEHGVGSTFGFRLPIES